MFHTAVALRLAHMLSTLSSEEEAALMVWVIVFGGILAAGAAWITMIYTASMTQRK